MIGNDGVQEFDSKALFLQKFIPDYGKLAKVAAGFQEIGWKVVVTIGSFDMLHIGHVRYLMQARRRGHILIVGLDTDRVMQIYKGIHRPLIPELERAEMVAYQIPVDFVTLVDDIIPGTEPGQGWQFELLKAVHPDVFIAVEDSYPAWQLDMIRGHLRNPGGVLEVLPRQASGSTSAVVDTAVKKRLAAMVDLLDAASGANRVGPER